jgi:ATP-binding cassette subfamily B (MDR/TAP) protein 6
LLSGANYNLRGVISSILVLKDGQIVEQGSHRELLALDGVFASMWTSQTDSASGDPAISIRSAKPEVSGYSADITETATTDNDLAPEVPPKTKVLDSPAAMAKAEPEEDLIVDQASLTFPSSEAVPEPESSSKVQSEPAPPVSPVVAFPVSDDNQSISHSVPPIPAGVTFEATSTPPRTGTPDPDSEPKRKRISSQNFQRLARRMSISTRKQGSISLIPGLKRSDSPRVSVDDSVTHGEGSLNDSPAPSVGEDGDNTKKKKKASKKDKKKTI